MITYALFFILLTAFLIRFNFFRLPRKGIVVLLYHRIDEKLTNSSLDKFSISADVFEKQLKYLKMRHFMSILPEDLQEIEAKGLWKKNRYVIITFDDGYKDNTAAAEILSRNGMKGLFFISTAYLGKKMNSVDMMSENDIKKLVSLKMAIGSHSHNHKKLSKIDAEDVKKEIKHSLAILNELCVIEDFAYPFGDYNDEVIEVLRNCGIKRAYIIGQKIYNPQIHSRYKIPRVIIRRDTTMLDFHLLITRGRAKF